MTGLQHLENFKRSLPTGALCAFQKPHRLQKPSTKHGRDMFGQASVDGADHTLWNTGPGNMLSTMLSMAGYPEGSQAIHRAFFANTVAPSLGRHPAGSGIDESEWKSFMTDDNTPLELSWSWPAAQATPVVRYSVEPIGWGAGTASDPLNTHASVELLRQTPPLALGVDLTWYRYFLTTLTVPSISHHELGQHGYETLKDAGALSQSFIAFDLQNNSMVAKYYFMPALKARVTGKTTLEAVQEAIFGLPGGAGDSFAAPLKAVSDYMHSLPPSDRPVVEIVAIECMDPSKSRIKVYIRSQKTSFADMLDVMTLGGRTEPLSDKARAEIAELWCAVFGIGKTDKALSDSSLLQQRKHRTAGLLYYLELKPNMAHPKSKVYLPARHYADNDDRIAHDLSNFLSKRGKGLVGCDYYAGVTRLFRHGKLADGLGFHTYITCTIDGDGPVVTVYLNPGKCGSGIRGTVRS
ncbi:tryptophan dimethylallyltransferase-domain-containing protein [Bombardia bombarda]|uniref:Tryptophan dimethylallyltransferase-domain-containing protein n=1 Tax=Bombardia bombarda TaxID=252184 RepID=A0AA39XBJ1_9PEZI|nr:tryptophan dimethylallyltransferase-domain-containing protein [Bombardia bombarda]